VTDLAATWLAFLADWSLRWAVLILGLMIVFAAFPPRAVATRLWLARLVLVGGLALPLLPRWWAVPQSAEADPAPPAPVIAPVESTSVKLEPSVTEDRERLRPPAARPPEPVAPPLPVAPSPEAPAAVSEPVAAEPAGPAVVPWPAIVAAMWLAGFGVLLVRLAVGRWWLARVRHAAGPIDGAYLREFEAARRELGIARPVVLLRSADVAGPALFGGRRPAVVVPTDWPTMALADRRAVLLHELTHVAHADAWAGLAEEVVRAAFFFHPLVHWLLRRLARDREQRCDAVAVRHGVEPAHLARVLFDGVRRLGPGRSVLAPRGATAMAHPSSASERIHQLLEADMTRWTRPLSTARAALAAAAVFGVCATVGGLGAKADPPAAPTAAPPAKAAKVEPAPGIRGTVKGEDGRPVAGATVLAVGDVGNGERLTTKTDATGQFRFDKAPAGKSAFPTALVIAVADGFAPATAYTAPTGAPEITLTLPVSGSYRGTVKDPAGRPVAKAEVQAGFVHRSGRGSSWGYLPAEAVRGTPAERFLFTTTDAAGGFEFTGVPLGKEIILRINAAGLAELDTGAGGPREGTHVVKADGKPAELALKPEAVIRGRVASRVAGVAPTAATIELEGREGLHGFRRKMKPDADGRFTAAGLPAGPISLAVVLPDDVPAVAAGTKVATTAGATNDVALEIIPGVVVTGRVRARGTGEPVAEVQMATIGLVNQDGFRVSPKLTGPDGRFTMRLPAGKVTVMVWSQPEGYGQPEGGRREVVIPDGVKAFEIPEPFELVKVVTGLSGKVIDAAGEPMPHVKVSGLLHASVCGDFATPPVTASFDGQFKLPYSPNGPLEPGRSVPLRVETADGRRFEAAALVRADGATEVRVPTRLAVEGPQDVKPDELAGLVVDEKGKPLAGVKVHLWDWVDSPENYTFTGADGRFRITAGKDRQVQVRYRKDGYSPVMATRQAVGAKGLVIAMDRATYFEGVIRGPDGKPAAGAIIRADQGPKMLDGGVYTQVWTQTTADADGRYRLYVEPDEYAFHVKAPGVGVARLPKTGIAHGQGRKYDVGLQPGITFKARVIDSLTGKPVAGLRLHDWEHKDVDGTSDGAGEITIKDLLPGEFTFTVKAEGYARWWSEQATREWERKSIDDRKTGWQRNFDGLTFDLKPGVAAVTVVAEPAVRVTGRVLDPDGKPVAGATVAPARTGSGNSLTGDTRFSEKTAADGTFVMTLPASGAAEYNLVAHDGGYQEWRTWANGVLPPVRTTPGQKINGVELRLTRPAVVRGKVVDAAGRPVAGREVRAHAADGLENRYYDPVTTTRADGTFELRFVRPAEQMLQAAPFWLRGADAPAGTSRTLALKPGEEVGDIVLVAAEERAK
jgi:hypothetical protein